MADAVVVDASVALGVILGEPAAWTARGILLDPGEVRLVVPDHFWLEIVNVLVRRYRRRADEVVAAVRDLDELGLETIAPDRPTLLLTLDRMLRDGLTAYDAAYLALAEAEDGRLLTLDAGLARAAGARAALGVPGAREGVESYGSTTAPPRWTDFGRYLADLRRDAAAT